MRFVAFYKRLFFIKKCEAKELFGKEDPLNSLFLM